MTICALQVQANFTVETGLEEANKAPNDSKLER